MAWNEETEELEVTDYLTEAWYTMHSKLQVGTRVKMSENVSLNKSSEDVRET